MSQFFSSGSLSETEIVGRQIAAQLSFPACVYLQGEMAAGKTTLAKSIINGLGYCGEVTSPTYNLIQEYPVDGGVVYHMDLYRVEQPSELEYLAIADLWNANSLFLVEWAERGLGYLQPADLEIHISKIYRKGQLFRDIILK